MNAPDLLHEWDTACNALNRERPMRDKLVAAGVLYRYELRAGGLGFARIRPVGRTYTPAPDGAPAVLVGAWMPCPPSIENVYGADPVTLHLADIVAFDLARPWQWWLRQGDGDHILGADQYLAGMDEGRPVLLHSTPLAWLQAGVYGACPLDHARRLVQAAPDLEAAA